MFDRTGNNASDISKMKKKYQRAQTLMQGVWNQKLVRNDTLFPHWIDGSDCFWYERAHKTGKEYRLVDAVVATNEIAFDHAALAHALAKVTKQDINPENLPIERLALLLSPLRLTFIAFEKSWKFDATDNICVEQTLNTQVENWVRSPDDRMAVFAQDYNLWIRDMASGEERSITQDGEEFYVYGAVSTAWGYPAGNNLQVRWSADSKKILTVQRDTRQVKTSPIIYNIPKDGGLRPTVEHVKMAYPGDDHIESYRLVAIDITTGQTVEAHYKQILTSPNGESFFDTNMGWWAKDDRHVYFIDLSRDSQIVRLIKFDTQTGLTDVLFEESSNTYINISLQVDDRPSHIYLPETNELIWCSERSGWFHLYLYDLDTGTLKNTITQGDWRIRDILSYVADQREVFIQTSGRVPNRDPVYRDICRVHIDTGEITTLCSSDDEYVVQAQGSNYLFVANIVGRYSHIDEYISGVAPSGNYVVTTRSRADQIPLSLLVNKAGETILELETADVSGLPAGWKWPEPFQFTSVDGKTDLYGLMFRPSDFKADRQYPVINCLLSNPMFPAVLKGSFFNGKPYVGWFYLQAAALAELGFIVVMIDSRGTPFRSKAFQDYSYGSIAAACDTEDHVTGIQQLANRYPYMDLNRVGIYGPTGYQGAIYNILERPDFYSTAVIHFFQDTRLRPGTLVGEKYEGLMDSVDKKPYPEQLVDGFCGNLLLVQPMLDPENLPANVFRFIDALQQANKDVDLLMLPNLGHSWSGYQIRRSWDYFIRHLMGVEPPKGFKLTTGVL